MPFLNRIFLSMDDDAIDGSDRVNTYGVGELDMFEFFVHNSVLCSILEVLCTHTLLDGEAARLWSCVASMAWRWTRDRPEHAIAATPSMRPRDKSMQGARRWRTNDPHTGRLLLHLLLT